MSIMTSDGMCIPYYINQSIWEVEDYTDFRNERNIRFFTWRVSMITIKKDSSIVVRLSSETKFGGQVTLESDRIDSAEWKYRSRYFTVETEARKVFNELNKECANSEKLV